MGKTTEIEWTDATWNPWYGCREVSPGCDHCYARTMLKRYGREWYVQRAASETFNAPLHWREPRMIFTCSLSDFFIEEANAWREGAWNIMQRTPWHTYQVLTKRPGLAVEWYRTHGWLGNVWLGTSVESAKYLPRLEVLARVPAAPVRFLSAEPLLGPLDLTRWLSNYEDDWRTSEPVLGWVIVGGESGRGARLMKEEWVQDILYQCQTAGVPFFFKQWGGSGDKRGHEKALLDGRLWQEWPKICEGVDVQN